MVLMNLRCPRSFILKLKKQWLKHPLQLNHSLKGKRSGVAGTKPAGFEADREMIFKNYPDTNEY